MQEILHSRIVYPLQNIHWKVFIIDHGVCLTTSQCCYGKITVFFVCLLGTYLFINFSYLRLCPREHRAVVLHAIAPIPMKLCQFKGSTPKLEKTKWFLFWFFRGEIDHPPVFLRFYQGNRLKIGKMYEAPTAMLFNQFLWRFAHILLHP